MKKSLLITIDFPPQLGGVATYLKNIYSLLPVQKTIVLAEGKTTDFDRRAAYKIHRQKLFFKYFWPRWSLLIIKTAKIIKKEKIEAIHTSHVLPIGYVAWFFKKSRGLPYLVYTHGLDIKGAAGNFWKKYWMVKILKGASRVVANSFYVRSELLKLGLSPEKIFVLRPCLDEKNLSKPSTREVERLKIKYNIGDKKVILTVGRLVRRKGHDIMIKVLAELYKKRQDFVYLIVGGGADRGYLEDLARRQGALPFVHFAGALSPEELPAYYVLCEFFAMPARELDGGDVEGFGIVFIEAAYYGKPSLAGKAGGMGEAVLHGRNGFTLDGEKEEELAEKIELLLDDEELRERLGRRARELSQEYFCRTRKEKINKIIF